MTRTSITIGYNELKSLIVRHLVAIVSNLGVLLLFYLKSHLILCDNTILHILPVAARTEDGQGARESPCYSNRESHALPRDEWKGTREFQPNYFYLWHKRWGHGTDCINEKR